jgi:hypothetical protein
MTKTPDIVRQIRCTVTSVHGVPLFLDHVIALYSGHKILDSVLFCSLPHQHLTFVMWSAEAGNYNYARLLRGLHLCCQGRVQAGMQELRNFREFRVASGKLAVGYNHPARLFHSVVSLET